MAGHIRGVREPAIPEDGSAGRGARSERARGSAPRHPTRRCPGPGNRRWVYSAVTPRASGTGVSTVPSVNQDNRLAAPSSAMRLRVGTLAEPT